MKMIKRNVVSFAVVLAAASILTSCSGEAKVEEATTSEPVEEITTPVEQPEVEDSTVTDEAPVKESSDVEVAPVKETKTTAKEPVKEANAATTTTSASKTVVAKVEQKAEEVVQKVAVPAMEFETKEFAFGDITEGDKVEYTFKFKNTGGAPLIISNARASCGCTVPEWPKEPIAPGASGKIDVVFNSRGKHGAQSKAITITTNIPDQPQQVVYLKGNVLTPEAPAAE